MILYEFVDSGNCYKIRMLLAELGMSYKRIVLSRNPHIRNTEEFLHKSPLGKVPVLELEGEYYTESLAILCFLSHCTKSAVLQWLSFEQSEIQTSIGAARYLYKFCNVLPDDDMIWRAHNALSVVESQLKKTQEYILNSGYSICDIALYAYIHLAPEAGISLELYPMISRWIKLIQSRPRYVGIYYI